MNLSFQILGNTSPAGVRLLVRTGKARLPLLPPVVNREGELAGLVPVGGVEGCEVGVQVVVELILDEQVFKKA